jgi:hypothetical protein
VPGYLWLGQPAVETIPENYPSDPAEGNDDTTTGDEKNDPYNNAGQLTSEDTVRASMLTSTGSDGDTFARKYQYTEFVRLNIGDKWYRVSDGKLWKIHYNFRKAGGIWQDDGSIIQENNSDW